MCGFHRWTLAERTASWRAWRCVECGADTEAPVNRTREIHWRARRVQLTVQEFLNDEAKDGR